MLQVGGAAAGRCQLADTHGAISHRRQAGFDFVLLIFFQIKYLTQLFPGRFLATAMLLTNFEASSCKRQSIQRAEGGRGPCESHSENNTWHLTATVAHHGRFGTLGPGPDGSG